MSWYREIMTQTWEAISIKNASDFLDKVKAAVAEPSSFTKKVIEQYSFMGLQKMKRQRFSGKSLQVAIENGDLLEVKS